VRSASELEAAIAGAKREAAAAFGDDSLLMEKFVERPRHVEVQVFGDTHGNIVSLFERECTLQRRHQKVVEEAPSAALNEERRELLYDAARKAAGAIGYVNAGTIEFVADERDAYFIEINTRLQVEHPVTEMLTGIDLVEWQLRIAMGEPLPLAQSEIKRRGHAIEARLYAEDPAGGFLPSIGTITHWRAPSEDAGLRIDSGFGEGDAVSQFYDPMLAKIIAHAQTRTEALSRLRTALAQFEVAGVTTNAPFLVRLLAEQAVIQNEVDTGYIEREGAGLGGTPSLLPPSEFQLAAACAVVIEHEKTDQQKAAADPYSPWIHLRCWTMLGARRRILRFRDKAGAEHNVTLIQERDRAILQICNDELAFAFEPVPGEKARFAITLGNKRRNVSAVREGETVIVFDGPDPIKLTLVDPFAANALQAPLESGLVAPMPGTIIALIAEPGETFEAGAPMLILEAMKMEHTLRFPARGMVKRYLCAAGDFVAEGAALAEFEAVKPE